MDRQIIRKRYGHTEIREWKKNKEKEKNAIKEGKNGRVGHVYIFKLYDGFYKIGCTYSIPQRMKALKASCPTLQCVWSAYVRDMVIVEQELHKYFQNKKVEREIFKLEPSDVRHADNLANQYR